ncbi:MAG: hypothetical protein O7D97_02590 [Planctomycetota bacterium]|nr:hypothetical protein [Planctomycetota bacterium]
MHRNRCFPSMVVGVTVVLAAAGSAGAQNALGSGNVLDANPIVGSAVRNLPSQIEDFRARNLLITGNVVGGRGFRGTVGYVAEMDFRGELGADTLFQFRAASALSSPSFVAAGQTFDRLRFGQQLGVIGFHRDGDAEMLRSLGRTRYVLGKLIDDRFRLDQITLFSTTAETSEASADPAIVSVFQSEEGESIVAIASSLRGLHVTPLHQHGQILGLTSYDLARTREDLEAGRDVAPLGTPFQAGFQDLRLREQPIADEAAEDRVEPATLQTRIEADLQPDYETILQRVAERYAASENVDLIGQPSVLERLDEQFEQLRRQLVEPDEDGTAESSEDPAGEPGELRPTRGTTPDGETPLLKIKDLGAIVRHGGQLDRLAGNDQTRFNELLAWAEEMLGNGEYFRAEQRFARALRLVPNHPLATSGLANAQIGAGLYKSASLALHRLFMRQSEMIDVQFGASLLPSRARLDIAIRVVREQMIGGQRDQSLNAFLLAYIGHQLGKRNLIEQGLAALADVSPDDPLLGLLNVVWLEEPDERSQLDDEPPARDEPQLEQ